MKNQYGENPEMLMDAYRMARSGNYTARQLLAELRKQFPSATEEQFRNCINRLADIAENQKSR